MDIGGMMKIAFLVGNVGISGGNYVILQHALFATSHGHSVSIITMFPGSNRKIWHPAMSQLRIVAMDSLTNEHFDIAIATWCGTVFELDRISADVYAYFVQSIESRFFDETQERLRAVVDRTYGLGLPGITEATWIKEHLQNRYGIQYHLVRNGIRKDLYKADGYTLEKRCPGKLRVLVEGPFGSSIKNTGKTINLCNKVKGLDIWLLTTTNISWYPRVGRVFSRVAIESVPPIYRSCDVLVKLSLIEGMFGPPLEMFHCGGTAIVYNVTGFDEYIMHDKNALVAEMGNEKTVIDYLKMLRDDSGLLGRLKTGALETADSWQDWNESSSNFLNSLEPILNGKQMGREELGAKIKALWEEFPEETNGLTGRSATISDPGYFPRLRKKIKTARSFLRYVREGF
jgi:O-antigen biosynthesis protein